MMPSAKSVASLVNAQTELTGVSASARTEVGIDSLVSGASYTMQVTSNNATGAPATVSFTVNALTADGLSAAVKAFNDVSAKTGVASDTKYRQLKDSTKKDQCKVYRNGLVTVIDVDDVVVGDKVLLQSGDKVPADGVLLRLDRLTLARGGREVVSALSGNFERGTLTAVTGPNGAGKTTFFNCLTGLYVPTSGRVVFDGAVLPPKPRKVVIAGVARTFQNIRLFANMFAGHLLLTVFTVAAFYLASPSVIGILGSATSFLMTVIFTAFEALIQALQAYIFTLLTAVYIAGSLHAEH